MSMEEQKNIIDEVIGKRVKELRVKQGLSMSKLARLASVSQSYISLLEKGERSPAVKHLLSICNALGVTMDEFLTNTLTDVQRDFLDNDSTPEYTRLCHLGRVLGIEELNVVLQVMEKLLENRTSPKSSIMLEEYLELIQKQQE